MVLPEGRQGNLERVAGLLDRLGGPCGLGVHRRDRLGRFVKRDHPEVAAVLAQKGEHAVGVCAEPRVVVLCLAQLLAFKRRLFVIKRRLRHPVKRFLRENIHIVAPEVEIHGVPVGMHGFALPVQHNALCGGTVFQRPCHKIVAVENKRFHPAEGFQGPVFHIVKVIRVVPVVIRLQREQENVAAARVLEHLRLPHAALPIRRVHHAAQNELEAGVVHVAAHIHHNVLRNARRLFVHAPALHHRKGGVRLLGVAVIQQVLFHHPVDGQLARVQGRDFLRPGFAVRIFGDHDRVVAVFVQHRLDAGIAARGKQKQRQRKNDQISCAFHSTVSDFNVIE